MKIILKKMPTSQAEGSKILKTLRVLSKRGQKLKSEFEALNQTLENECGYKFLAAETTRAIKRLDRMCKHIEGFSKKINALKRDPQPTHKAKRSNACQ